MPSEAAARLDWHNDRAAFLLGLNAALEQAPDDKAREALLRRMVDALGVDPDQGAAGPDRAG